MPIPDILGLLGGALLLFGYARKDHLPRLPAGLINFTGAGLVGYNAWVQSAWGPFALEAAWMAIALWTLRPASAR
jgi:hypothetical protein